MAIQTAAIFLVLSNKKQRLRSMFLNFILRFFLKNSFVADYQNLYRNVEVNDDDNGDDDDSNKMINDNGDGDDSNKCSSSRISYNSISPVRTCNSISSGSSSSNSDSYCCYRPRMQRGNVFVVSVFLCVCMSVQAVTFEADGIGTFFLAQW